MLVLQLGRLLPPEYYAAPQIHLGGSVEIDVGTYERDEARTEYSIAGGNGGTATAVWTGAEPTLRVESDLPDVDEYEVRVYDVKHERRLVAAIEIVSPSNKDRPVTRQAFVSKCAALLRQDVSVTIVDVVTTRDFNLYAELLALQDRTDSSLTDPPSNIYAVACRHTKSGKRGLMEAWHVPLAVGQPLPSLPIWLAENHSVTVDFESSYEEACRAVRIA
jgi:hypothetical protein